jgi:hypothetical protein
MLDERYICSLWPGTLGNLLSESNGPGQGEGGQGG